MAKLDAFYVEMRKAAREVELALTAKRRAQERLIESTARERAAQAAYRDAIAAVQAEFPMGGTGAAAAAGAPGEP